MGCREHFTNSLFLKEPVGKSTGGPGAAPIHSSCGAWWQERLTGYPAPPLCQHCNMLPKELLLWQANFPARFQESVFPQFCTHLIAL